MTLPYTGKVALVTGASRGIGSTLARAFAAKGAKVIVHFNGSAAQAEEVARHIREQGGEAVAIQADIGKVVEVEKLFRQALDAYGQLDILVNNAGIMVTKPILDITENDYDRLFAVHAKGTFFACQQAALHMKEGGRIINFSTSVTGSMFPHYSVYAGAKGAVEQFTRQLAKEFGPKGITINAVAPGPINTELFLDGKTEAQVQAIVSMNSFGRLGETDDVVGSVLFLASEEARWITGQTVRVNGGYV